MELRKEDSVNIEIKDEIKDTFSDIEDTPVVNLTPKLNREEFYKHHLMKTLRNRVNNAALLCYLSAIATVLLMILDTIQDKSLNVTAMVVSALISAILLIGVGLGIQLLQSKVCAYIMLAIAIINCIASIILMRMPGGIIPLIISIMLVSDMNTFEKAWIDYQITGNIMDTNVNNPFAKYIK